MAIAGNKTIDKTILNALIKVPGKFYREVQRFQADLI
jgi:hypothetical protein